MNDHPFRAFINLIEHDQEIRHVRSQIEQTHQELTVIEDQERQARQELDQAKEQVKHTRKQVDLLELEMKDLDGKEQEKKRQLESTSSSKEYQALKKEIAQLKLEQHEKEETLLQQWNQLDTVSQAMKAKQTEFDQQIITIHEAMNQKLKVLKDLETDVLTREREREAKEGVVPTEWLEKYRHMRTQIADPVVPVISGSCGACFTTITEADMIRLTKRALIQCKGCFRLMYLQGAWKDVAAL